MEILKSRILITGGKGFLGSHLLDKLREIGCKQVFSPSSQQYDLTKPNEISALFESYSPELVIHLAGIIGGIQANKSYPGEFFYKNALMGLELIENSRRFGVEKFVQIGTACSYPKKTEIPFREDDFWNGFPIEDTAYYGMAKKMLLVQLDAYRRQYGFNGVYLILTNLYGPRDNFDLSSGHVIPSLIRKFHEAKSKSKSTVEVWGRPEVSRDFLFVGDAVEAIVKSVKMYDSTEPLNIGSGVEVTMEQLTSAISEILEYDGAVEWNNSRPIGQPRRLLETQKAKEHLKFSPSVTLEEGLRSTVNWYLRSLPE